MTLPSWRHVNMTAEEKAWIVQKWINGRTQIDIGNELGYSPAIPCNAIALFCEEWAEYSKVRSRWIYNEDRKAVAATALQNFISQTGLQPARPAGNNQKEVEQYHLAKAEHVWLLRAEGLKLQQISNRVGLTRETVRQITDKFGRRMQRAMRHTRWHFE